MSETKNDAGVADVKLASIWSSRGRPDRGKAEIAMELT